MSVAFVAASTSGPGSGGSFSASVDKPAGVVDGDLIIVQGIVTEGIDSGPTYWESGGTNVAWTELLDDGVVVSGKFKQYVFDNGGAPEAFYVLLYRIASSDPSTYTFTVGPGFGGGAYGMMGYSLQAVAYRDATIDAYETRYDDTTPVTTPQSSPAVASYAAKSWTFSTNCGASALASFDLVGATNDHLWMGMYGTDIQPIVVMNVPSGSTSRSVIELGGGPDHGLYAADGDPVIINPCGEYPGEVLEVADTYVGDFDEPGVELWWPQGESFEYWEYPCGTIGWLYSPRWASPWAKEGCLCAEEHGQFVPILILGSYFGSFVTFDSDTTGPPGLESKPALIATGTGLTSGNFTFWPNTWDYWHPDVGSQWVWQGWARPHNLANIGDKIRAGWGTVDWGYSAVDVGVLDGAITYLDGAQTMPDGTVTVLDTSAFDDSGTFYIESDFPPPAPLLDAVTYTGKTATTLTGCSGGTHAHASGAVVWQPQWSFFQKTRTIIAPWGNVVAAGPQVPTFGWYGDGFLYQENREVDLNYCFCHPEDPTCAPDLHTYTKYGPRGTVSFKCLHVYPVVAPPEPATGVFSATETLLLPFRDPNVTLGNIS